MWVFSGARGGCQNSSCYFLRIWNGFIFSASHRTNGKKKVFNTLADSREISNTNPFIKGKETCTHRDIQMHTKDTCIYLNMHTPSCIQKLYTHTCTRYTHTLVHKIHTDITHTRCTHTHTVQQHGTQKERFPTKQSGFFFSSTTGSFMCLYEVLMFGQFEQRLGTGRPTVLNKHFPIRVL